MTAAHDRPIVRQSKPDRTGRRRLFKAAAVGGVAATAALATAGPASASAGNATGNPDFLTLGVAGYAAIGGDEVDVTHPALTLESSAPYSGIDARQWAGPSGTIYDNTIGAVINAWGWASVLVASQSGNPSTTADVVRADTDGLGRVVSLATTNPANATPSVEVDNSGVGPALAAVTTNHANVGPAVQGTSAAGYGGWFAGRRAPIHLAPGRSTHPSVGATGDFYVTARGDLWFCKGGRNWRQIA